MNIFQARWPTAGLARPMPPPGLDSGTLQRANVVIPSSNTANCQMLTLRELNKVDESATTTLDVSRFVQALFGF